MQEKITNFYSDFGVRFRFIREKKGLTLTEISEGKPSTAQSWETGKQPRRERWNSIADKFNLSDTFIFLGRPVLENDYEFIANFRSQIGLPPGISSIAVRAETSKSGDDINFGGDIPAVGEPVELYRTNLDKMTQNLQTRITETEVEEHLKQWLVAARTHPFLLGYIHAQLKLHLPVENLERLTRS